jgi:hypothetical protein
MKKIIGLISCLLVVLMAVIVTNTFAQTHHEFDKSGYTKIVKKAIGQIISGNIDTGKMLTDMDKLVAMGIAGCEEHMGEKETPAVEVKMMKYTIDNAQSMSSLSLDKIEEQWHEGGFLKSKGIDLNSFSHFDEVMSHYDAIVHPATVIICLKEYEKSKNEELLEQMKAELAEVKEHIEHIE